MLHEFLTAHRAELIDGCRLKVARRRTPQPTDAELEHGIPLFLDQLVETLRLEQSSETMRSRAVSGPAGGTRERSDIGTTAGRHGVELLDHGFTVDQVVHDYGDLCQAITDLAFERGKSIAVEEFRTLNRCLDNAIADAVTEFGRRRDLLANAKQTHAFNERLGSLAHELRDLVHTAVLALAAVKTGKVGLDGATGAVLERSLGALHRLADRSIADVRANAASPARLRLIPLAEFIAEIQASASLVARARNRGFEVVTVDPALAVNADRELLLAALGNLLHNAFKFSLPGSEVKLRAYGAADRVLIEVEDRCGGLAPGDSNRMFRPLTQGHGDRSGLGLGLSMSRRNVEANGGVLRVRDLPGTGCVFSIDLPCVPAGGAPIASVR